MSAPTMPEPSRRVKELNQAKVSSSRPPAKLWSHSNGPDIEVGEESELEGYDENDEPGSH